MTDWPLTVHWLRSLAERLAERLDKPTVAVVSPRFFGPGRIPRNLFFLALVLAHAFRRLLPPYS